MSDYFDRLTGRGKRWLAALAGYVVFLIVLVAGYFYLLNQDIGSGFRQGLIWGAVSGLVLSGVAVAARLVRARRR